MGFAFPAVDPTGLESECEAYREVPKGRPIDLQIMGVKAKTAPKMTLKKTAAVFFEKDLKR